MGGRGTALLMSFQGFDQGVPGSPAIVMQEAIAVVFGRAPTRESTVLPLCLGFIKGYLRQIDIHWREGPLPAWQP